jgi:GNAT superfamily N-acetyltransferase
MLEEQKISFGLPSLEARWHGGQRSAPRVQVVEVRHRERPRDAPVAWLLMERQTACHHAKDGTVESASILISYEVIDCHRVGLPTERGSFGGSYSAFHGISLTSELGSGFGGALFLDPARLRGHRIGTYLMSQIVTWAKRWPDAAVRSIQLLPNQAQADNRERRNRFYERFNLTFDYDDPSCETGRSRAMLAGDLVTVDTWKENIFEHSVREHLTSLLDNQHHLRFQLEGRERAIEDQRKVIAHAYARPLRWALAELWGRYRTMVGLGCAVLATVGLVWARGDW